MGEITTLEHRVKVVGRCKGLWLSGLEAMHGFATYRLLYEFAVCKLSISNSFLMDIK